MISRKFQSTLAIWLLAALFFTPLRLSAASSTGHTQIIEPVTAEHTHSQQQVTTTKSKIGEVDSFIIRSVDGHVSCQGASPEEVQSTLPRPDDIGIPVRELLNKQPPNQLQSGSENATTGLTINLVALSQLQGDPNRDNVIAAFQRAAAVWTDRIKSPITISIRIDYGLNTPGAEPFGNNILGSTSSRRVLIDYPGARTQLLAGSSGPAETAIYNMLPTSFVPTNEGNGGVVALNRSVAFALGVPVISPSDDNVATIGFNKAFSFDFNPDNGISFGMTDFVAVAAHEIGHALGFISGAGGGVASFVTLWDIFRFPPGTDAGTLSTGERVMTIGGEQVYFTGQSFTVAGIPTTELRLSTGGPDPEDDDGDGNQSSHWKDDTQNFNRFIGIMDPSIAPGVREEATENDFATLEMIGWNLISSVAPPPPPPAPPAPANDNFANAQIITGCSGSVSGTNVAATREAGETINHSPDNGGGSRSVWYRWQAPSTGAAEIFTFGSRFDTVMGVYAGSAVNSLAPIIGKHDDVSGDDKSSSVAFNAVEGTVYRIAVDGYNNGGSGGDFGPIKLNWTVANCANSWTPTALNASQVELKSWQVVGRTFVYAKLTFPDAGFRVSNWGTPTRVGNDFSSDALVERFSGVSAQAISSTAQIWDLGPLTTGSYTFTFKNSGTTVKTLNFTVSATPPPPNPIDDARTFVFWQYKDFLRRDPDGPGWDHWTGEITQCTDIAFRRPGETEAQCVDRKRENTSAAFFVSPESLTTGYFVLRVYRGSLGRMPFFGGTGNPNDEFTRDVAVVSQGIVVNNALSPSVINANKQAFVNQFVTRTDFLAIYGGLNNTQYVDRLFQTTGVTPTAGERQALIDGLNLATETRASVLFKVVDGTTATTGGVLVFNTNYGKAFYDNHFNAAFVQMEYFGYLQRDSDPDGYTFWLNKLNTFGDWVNAEMVKAFINSPEYRSRFGAP
jgi:hypothetical protein